MRHGGNYHQHMEGILAEARAETRRLGQILTAAEAALRRVLPPDETPSEIGCGSRQDREIAARREAWREAHAQHCAARGWEAEIASEVEDAFA